MVSTLFARRLLQAAAGCSMFAATTALAQDRLVLTWTGRVDKEVQLTIRDTSVSTSIVGGAPVTVKHFRVQDPLPRREGAVRVELEAGRGDVDVIQQPSATNDWSAIVRIRDHSSGKDDYTVRTYWNPKSGEDRYSTAAVDARAKAAEKPVNTLHWTGSVDREMKIEWRGFDVQSHSVNGEAAREVHSSASHALPRADVTVDVSVRRGRGDVTVIQQPTASNGYTCILRIRDPQEGFGPYEIDAKWR